MNRSRSVRAAFVLRRMRASRLLVGCVLLTTLVTTALLAALADFSAVTLTGAAEQQVAVSRQLGVRVSSTASTDQAGPAARFVAAALRSAFGPQGLAMQSARWSNPLKLPTPAGAGSQWTAEVAALDGIARHARVVAGAWPLSRRPGQPYDVAVPDTVVSQLGVRLGQSLTLTDADTGIPVTVHITGIYHVDDPAARYWGLDVVAISGVTVQPGFRTYGPFLAAADTFAAGRLTVGQRSWLATPASPVIRPGGMRTLAARVQRAVVRLGQSPEFGIVASSNLPDLLTGTAASYEVARSLLVVAGLELLLVACAAMALAAGLLASGRETESALLTARGLTRRQVALLAVSEAAAAATVGAAAGVVVGAALARLVAGPGTVRGVRASAATLSQAAWWPAIVVVVLTTIVLAWPAAGPVAAAGLQARRGRPAVAASVSRAGADVAVIVLAAITTWQLRQYSAVARSPGGTLGIDPVLVVAPALILAALAIVPLRLMPALAGLADRLAGHGTRLTTALAAWQLSRRPVRQTGPALLVIFAVGASTLALSEGLSWRESVHAQAAMIVGADARIDVPPGGGPPVAALVDAPGVRAAMPVTTFDGGLPGQVLAVDASAAPGVVLLRRDQSGQPAARLWRLITPSARPPGVPVPGRPVRLAVLASLGRAPASWQLGPLAASLSVQAADGVVYALPAGALPADGGSRVLTAVIPAADRASYPLRVVGVTLAYQLPPATVGRDAARRLVSLTVSGLAASALSAGPLSRFAAGTALGSWQRTAASVTLATNQAASGLKPAIGSWRRSARGSLTASLRPGDGQLVPRPGLPPLPVTAAVTLTAQPGIGAIPGIATRSFATATGVGVGSEVAATVGPYHVPVRIVAELPTFPTIGTGSALIIDQGAVQALLASVSAPPLSVTSWWLSTTGGLPAGRVARAPVTSLRRVADGMLENPLSAAPQQVEIAIAAAVAVLATLGFAVSVAASVTERRASNALLAAIGVSRLSRARQLCLEQAMLATPAALAGLLAGAVIARLLIPAVTLTRTGTRPVPPALVYLPIGWAAGLAAAVAILPVLAAAATVVSSPDPAAELRATGTA